MGTILKDENSPLLSNSNKKQSYLTDNDQVLVKSIDEESNSSSSSESTIDIHDEEYLVKNRLGEASLALITLWYTTNIQ